MGNKISKYKLDKNYNKQKNKVVNKQIITKNKFNHVKVRYTEYGTEVTNKTVKYSHMYNGVPGGWYIE